MYSSILLATDGNPGALGAVRLALEAATLHNAQLQVVAVYDPSPWLAGLSDPLFASAYAHDVDSVEALRERVSSQLEAEGGPGVTWNLTVKSGPVAPMIARAASRFGAELIVLGLREYAPGEHWIRRETPLRVMNLAHVPVLAVPPSAQRLPRTVVLATDLGSVSLGAAREARTLSAPDAELHLAFVLPSEAAGSSPSHSDRQSSYRSGIELRLGYIEEELTHDTRLHSDVHLLSGDVGDAILNLARDTNAELIVVGSHSNSPFERLILGTVATHVVRGADCSVLVAPSARVPSDLRRNLIETEVLAHFSDLRVGISA